MKKTVILIMAVVCSMALFSQKVDLSLNLKEGQVVRQSIDMRNDVKMEIMGMPMDMSMPLQMALEMKVVEINDTSYLFDTYYTAFDMTMAMESTKKEVAGAIPTISDSVNLIINKMLHSILNKPFQMRVSRLGVINEVAGLENLFENLYDGDPNITPEQRAQMAQQISAVGTSDQLKSNLSSALVELPAMAVGVGDKWTRSSLRDIQGISLLETIECSLVKLTDNEVVIKQTTKYQPKDKKGKIKIQGMEMQLVMNGSGNATYTIDRVTGWTTEGSGDMDVKMDMSMKQGKEKMGMTVIMKSKYTTNNK